MNAFEKQYYESEDFWEGEMLQDNDNILRFQATESLIPEEIKNFADIGCGNGVFVNHLLSSRPLLNITAVDRSSKALEFVKSNKVQAEITSLPFDNRCFDCVTCLEVLEHLSIDDFPLAINELSRVADKYIIVSVPFAERTEESYTKCPACKSIFNRELHLQSFDEAKFINLFERVGFKNISVQKMNPVTTYKWHFQYRKLFYPEQLLQWQAPVCPLCGYKEGKKSTSNSGRPSQVIKPRKFISYLGGIPKMIWPKETSYYWIMGLFQRVQ
jgi:ubiquinone/menaquinone biosynthesis C-methylase UbiE